jgi:hypothetical protein
MGLKAPTTNCSGALARRPVRLSKIHHTIGLELWSENGVVRTSFLEWNSAGQVAAKALNGTTRLVRYVVADAEWHAATAPPGEPRIAAGEELRGWSLLHSWPVSSDACRNAPHCAVQSSRNPSTTLEIRSRRVSAPLRRCVASRQLGAPTNIRAQGALTRLLYHAGSRLSITRGNDAAR